MRRISFTPFHYFLIAPYLAAGHGAAGAAIIATYDFNGDGDAALESAFSGVVNALPYDPRSAAIGEDSSSNTISGFSTQNDNVYLRTSGTLQNSLPGSGTNAFHTFSLSVSGLGVGEVLDLTSISFTHAVTGTTGSTAFFTSFFSDAVGFDDLNDRLGNSLLASDPLSESVEIDLTPSNSVASTAFTGLTNGTDVEFRIYFGDDGVNDDSTNSIHRIQEPLTISGDIRVIPEPADIALVFAVGAGLFAAMRRRTRNRGEQ